jgi:hypothetical protein
MQIAGFTWFHAPLVTGHPLGLPQTRPATAPVLRVTPVTGSDSARHRTEAAPVIWHPVKGAQDQCRHTPPPSIVQIRISRILNDQASGSATTDPHAPEAPHMALAGTAEGRASDGSERVFLPFESRRPAPDEDPGALLIVMAPDGGARPNGTTEIPSRPLPAYEETASLSRSAVFNTLP